MADERGVGEIPEGAVLRNTPCGRHPAVACRRLVGHRAELFHQERRRLLGAVLASEAGIVVEHLSDPFGVGAVALGVELDRLVLFPPLGVDRSRQVLQLALQLLDAAGEGAGAIPAPSRTGIRSIPPRP